MVTTYAYPTSLTFEFFGVTIEVTLKDSTLLKEVIERLPPAWEHVSEDVVAQRRYLIERSGKAWNLGMDDRPPQRFNSQEELLDALEGEIQLFVAEYASPHLFLHAGVVEWNGSAILLPGRSFAGKSTLVTALVMAGATYYSDEYAVLDDQGQVWPYRRRVSLRSGPLGPARRLDMSGDDAFNEPLLISLVAFLRYRPGGTWQVRSRTPAEAVMLLADQTVGIRHRPKDALAYLNRIATTASVIEGVRGEVDDAIERLLSMHHCIPMR